MREVQDVEHREHQGEAEGEQGVDAPDEDRVVDLVRHARRLKQKGGDLTIPALRMVLRLLLVDRGELPALDLDDVDLLIHVM
ncbi:MAG: hypothetical protein NVS9B6_16800 [Candidatus Limnocylindrales bacterium]